MLTQCWSHYDRSEVFLSLNRFSSATMPLDYDCSGGRRGSTSPCRRVLASSFNQRRCIVNGDDELCFSLRGLTRGLGGPPRSSRRPRRASRSSRRPRPRPLILHVDVGSITTISLQCFREALLKASAGLSLTEEASAGLSIVEEALAGLYFDKNMFPLHSHFENSLTSLAFFRSLQRASCPDRGHWQASRSLRRPWKASRSPRRP